ncbi:MULTISPECIES: M35 family metallo-endopeptidase [Burkholderiaceae]|uniref:M35 family metallo-endopeptidase n=1 Tax=Burkholderiaceae TaxID=119060 RepID=UPI000B89AA63|nr:M35 family metallo-endopeptidase [Ralstonia sp. 25mfcol4.1]
MIHELTHFEDTFSARDWQYSMRECLGFARTHPHLATQNADSITGYVIYER